MKNFLLVRVARLAGTCWATRISYEFWATSQLTAATRIQFRILLFALCTSHQKSLADRKAPQFHFPELRWKQAKGPASSCMPYMSASASCQRRCERIGKSPTTEWGILKENRQEDIRFFIRHRVRPQHVHRAAKRSTAARPAGPQSTKVYAKSARSPSSPPRKDWSKNNQDYVKRPTIG